MPELTTPSVPAVERALAILELLAHSRSGLSVSEVGRSLKLPKSSVHCVVLTLERTGYIHRNTRTGRYRLGLKLLRLANTTPGGFYAREEVATLLRVLMERTGLTVHMAILDGREAVLVDKVDAPGLFRLATWVGKRMDLHCTAIGKALASGLSNQDLEQLVRERPLVRHNDNTIISIKRLKLELDRVRAQGFALDDEEEEIGLRCIGVAVPDGHANTAISISGTTSHINAQNLAALADEVKSTAALIAEILRRGEPAA